MEQKNGNVAVLKQKMIKTDELVNLFISKHNNLKKLKNLYNNLQEKHEETLSTLRRFELENERLVYTVEKYRNKQDILEEENKNLLSGKLTLEYDFNKQVVEKMSTIKDLQDELKMIQDLSLAAENMNSDNNKKSKPAPFEKIKKEKNKGKLVSHEKEKNKLEPQIEYEDVIAELNNENKYLSDKVQEIGQKNKEYVKEISKLQKQLQEATSLEGSQDEVVERSKNEITDLKHKISSLSEIEDKIGTLQVENEMLKDELRRREQELHEMESERNKTNKINVEIQTDFKVIYKEDKSCLENEENSYWECNVPIQKESDSISDVASEIDLKELEDMLSEMKNCPILLSPLSEIIHDDNEHHEVVDSELPLQIPEIIVTPSSPLIEEAPNSTVLDNVHHEEEIILTEMSDTVNKRTSETFEHSVQEQDIDKEISDLTKPNINISATVTSVQDELMNVSPNTVCIETVQDKQFTQQTVLNDIEANQNMNIVSPSKSSNLVKTNSATKFKFKVPYTYEYIRRRSKPISKKVLVNKEFYLKLKKQHAKRKSKIDIIMQALKSLKNVQIGVTLSLPCSNNSNSNNCQSPHHIPLSEDDLSPEKLVEKLSQFPQNNRNSNGSSSTLERNTDSIYSSQSQQNYAPSTSTPVQQSVDKKVAPAFVTSQEISEGMIERIAELVSNKLTSNMRRYKKRRTRPISGYTDSLSSTTEPEIERLFQNSSDVDILQRNKMLLRTAKLQNERLASKNGIENFDQNSCSPIETACEKSPNTNDDILVNPRPVIQGANSVDLGADSCDSYKQVSCPPLLSPMSSLSGSPGRTNILREGPIEIPQYKFDVIENTNTTASPLISSVDPYILINLIESDNSDLLQLNEPFSNVGNYVEITDKSVFDLNQNSPNSVDSGIESKCSPENPLQNDSAEENCEDLGVVIESEPLNQENLSSLHSCTLEKTPTVLSQSLSEAQNELELTANSENNKEHDAEKISTSKNVMQFLEINEQIDYSEYYMEKSNKIVSMESVEINGYQEKKIEDYMKVSKNFDSAQDLAQNSKDTTEIDGSENPKNAKTSTEEPVQDCTKITDFSNCLASDNCPKVSVATIEATDFSNCPFSPDNSPTHSIQDCIETTDFSNCPASDNSPKTSIPSTETTDFLNSPMSPDVSQKNYIQDGVETTDFSNRPLSPVSLSRDSRFCMEAHDSFDSPLSPDSSLKHSEQEDCMKIIDFSRDSRSSIEADNCLNCPLSPDSSPKESVQNCMKLTDFSNCPLSPDNSTKDSIPPVQTNYSFNCPLSPDNFKNTLEIILPKCIPLERSPDKLSQNFNKTEINCVSQNQETNIDTNVNVNATVALKSNHDINESCHTEKTPEKTKTVLRRSKRNSLNNLTPSDCETIITDKKRICTKSNKTLNNPTNEKLDTNIIIKTKRNNQLKINKNMEREIEARKASAMILRSQTKSSCLVKNNDNDICKSNKTDAIKQSSVNEVKIVKRKRGGVKKSLKEMEEIPESKRANLQNTAVSDKVENSEIKMETCDNTDVPKTSLKTRKPKNMTKLKSSVLKQMKQKSQMFKTGFSNINEGTTNKIPATIVTNSDISVLNSSKFKQNDSPEKKHSRNAHATIPTSSNDSYANKQEQPESTIIPKADDRISSPALENINNPLRGSTIPHKPKTRNTTSNSCDILTQIIGEMDKGRPKQPIVRPVCPKKDVPSSMEDKQWRVTVMDMAEITQNKVDIKDNFDPDIGQYNNKGKSCIKKQWSKKMKVLVDKLFESSSVENISDEVIVEFKRLDLEDIIDLILHRLSQDIYEKPETSHYPAPLMTKTQRLFLRLMLRLEQEKVDDVISTFFSKTENLLFRIGTNVKSVVPITRLYLAVCRLQGNVNRMRTFCCQAFLYMGDLAVPLFFTVLTSWIDIMPVQAEWQKYSMSKILVQIVHLKGCNKPGYNLIPLRQLLHQHYGYPKERWNCDEIFEELTQQYLRDASEASVFALRLLCKNKDTKWIYQKLNEFFKPLVYKIPSENVNFRAHVIILIGKLCRQFKPKNNFHDETCLLEMKRFFSALLEDDNVHEIIKCSVQLSIDRLPKIIPNKNTNKTSSAPKISNQRNFKQNINRKSSRRKRFYKQKHVS